MFLRIVEVVVVVEEWGVFEIVMICELIEYVFEGVW